MNRTAKYSLTASLTLVALITLALVVPPPTSPGPVGPYLNGVFPTEAPTGSAWELAEALPGMYFRSPLRVLHLPGTDDIMVLNKAGEIWQVSLENHTRRMLLDIKDRTFKKGEGGSVGMALHPEFGNPDAPDKQLIFIYYRTKPEPDEWSEKGFNRLSKFAWDAATETFDPASEEILFQQYDRCTWHNGGSMFFDNSGFLCVSVGDEGFNEQIAVSTQRLDGGFFSGVLRIDVDNDPSRSHPIRRQPLTNAEPPSGWGPTYSQGYSIPNDNPWLDPDGGILEEFFALGVRGPYDMYYDRDNDEIWMADVGAAKREEISRFGKGDNLQWPFREGIIDTDYAERPEDVIGEERPPYYDYDHSVGSAIIGGAVYTGTRYTEMNGRYLFGDYMFDKIMALTQTGTQGEPEFVELLNLNNQTVEIPEEAGITGIHPIRNGEILVTVMGDDGEENGKIYYLVPRETTPEPPGKLSETGAFVDLETLTPAPGVIPYTVNSPLWSDRAAKQRWMVLPNDGFFDSPDEQIRFSGVDSWDFPEGTVFIKHFELPTTLNQDGETIRLETRFFVMMEDGRGYGVTYKWNEDGTEAYLLGGGATQEFDVKDELGNVAYTQTWDFPSRSQCMSCHTVQARHVLGVKTHQLNGELWYPHLQESRNQLEYLNELGVFHQDIGASETYLQAASLQDQTVDLETRIRAYLDANCSPCHRPGGVSLADIDLRFATPLSLQNSINFPTQSLGSNPGNMIIHPGNHAASELWVRDASNDGNRMPPLGRHMVDSLYIELLAEWIDNLPEDAGKIYEFSLYPNPTSGWVSLRFSDEWEPPFTVYVSSLNGHMLKEVEIDAYSGQLDLTHLGAGTYLLDVRANGNQQVQKVVVK